MNRRLALTLTILMLLLALASVSQAATTMYNDRASWEAAVVTWADVDLSPYAEFSTLTSVALPALALPATTLSFDVTQTVLQVGSSWGSWSGGTPRVLYSGIDSVNGSFDAALMGFGMKMEPNVFDEFEMTLNLVGGGSLTQTVDGSGGAAFFGFLSDTGVTGWTASAPAAAGSFAIGDMVVAGPGEDHNGSPELSTWMLLSCSGLTGLVGLVLRRRRTA